MKALLVADGRSDKVAIAIKPQRRRWGGLGRILVILAAMLHTSVMMRAAPEPAIDWPAFMRRHDMTFDKLPGGWTEAPHFGNAMVSGN